MRAALRAAFLNNVSLHSLIIKTQVGNKLAKSSYAKRPSASAYPSSKKKKEKKYLKLLFILLVRAN